MRKHVLWSVLLWLFLPFWNAPVFAQGEGSANGVAIRPIIEDADWVFIAPDSFKVAIRVDVTTFVPKGASLVLKITTDDFIPVKVFSVLLPDSVPQGFIRGFVLSQPQPGFYRCTASVVKGGKPMVESSFQVGYEPEKIVSPRDAKPDFESFWKTTRAQLDQVPMEVKMQLLKQEISGPRDVYHVQMQSLGHVLIEGFYAVPKGGGKHPAIIGFMGYNSPPYYPSLTGNADFCELILSMRGQGIQKATNTYGDWIVWGLDSKENYYYRGAFMDAVRGIDFLCSRPEVDTTRIVAEGASQGGAFTLVACALDKRIKAAAPTIPFLSDYRDYFKIVAWPVSSFQNYMRRNPSRTWNEIYDLLTYFDVKNFCQYIKCPIIMSVGLQDETCPPHINFSGYNLIPSKKQYFVARDKAHALPSTWGSTRMAFFKKILGVK